MKYSLLIIILVLTCCIMMSCSKKSSDAVNNIVSVPTFSVAPGGYDTPQIVEIYCTTIDAVIHYTLDGTDPDANSAIYANPIQVDSTKTIKARAYKEGWDPSPIVTGNYMIPVPAPVTIDVSGGSFNMGDAFGDGTADVLPIHQVTVNAFKIGKYEVNQSEWLSIMGTNPSSWIDYNRPVDNVTWYSVMAYCNKLSIKEGFTPCYTYTGFGTNPSTWPLGWNVGVHNNFVCDFTANGYRLPTEAEWEYAAKGGAQASQFEFAGSNAIADVTWFLDNSLGASHSVGQKTANAVGAFDMSGNVWEYCWDWFSDYNSAVQNNPVGPDNGTKRVIRGGCWYNSRGFCRVATRGFYTPQLFDYGIGFRVCRTMP